MSSALVPVAGADAHDKGAGSTMTFRRYLLGAFGAAMLACPELAKRIGPDASLHYKRDARIVS